MKIHNHLDFAAAARAVNLLDPAAAQDAATKAYVDALHGWKDIALVAPDGVGVVDFAPIDQSYSDLRLVLEGISHNSGSNQQCALAISANGSTFSSATGIGGNFAASATAYGSYEFQGYCGDGGAVLGQVANLTSSPMLSSGSTQNLVWRCTGGIRGLRFSVSGGAVFDGGQIRLQARR